MNHPTTPVTTHEYDSDAAIAAYVDLVRAIGPGFHPDTDGGDYASLPDGYTPGDVDRIVEAATDHCDVYVVALDVLDGGDGTGPYPAPALGPVPDLWTALGTIADALGARVDPHGLIDVAAAGDRFVLVDHEGDAFRVGLYERDHDLALVLIETPTVGYAIEAARVLSRPGVEVNQ